MFERQSLKAKLMIFALFNGFCLLLLGSMSLYSLKRITNVYGHVSHVNLPNSITLSDLLIAQRDMANTVVSLLHADVGKEKALRAKESYQALLAKFEKACAEYETIEFVDGEKEKWQAVLANWKPLKIMIEKILDLSESGKAEDRVFRDKLAAKELVELRREFRAGAEALVVFQAQEARKWSSDAERIQETSQWQDEASSAVFGMPREAIAQGAAGEICPLEEIPQAILRSLHDFRKHS